MKEPSVVLREPAKGLLCPVCRADLLMSDRQGIEIDYCPQCRGIWLDRGELDKIIERSAELAEPDVIAPPEPRRESRSDERDRDYDNTRDRHGDKYDDRHRGRYRDDDRGKHGDKYRRKSRRKSGIADFLGELFD
jgi:uncharacterized protein